MKDLRIDFIVHWLWAIVFGLLLITGLTLMSAKLGWLLNYQIPLADYLHRTLSAIWVMLTFFSIILEAIRLSKKTKVTMPWQMVNKSVMGIFTLVITLLFAMSGIFLWICTEFSHTVIAFAFVIHDLLTLIAIPVIIWHIYDNAYGLPLDTGVKKNV